MRKHILPFILILIMGIALLTGCSSKNTMEPDSSEPIHSGASAPSSEAQDNAEEVPEPAVSVSPETEVSVQPSEEPVPEVSVEPEVTHEPPAESSTPAAEVTPAEEPSEEPSGPAVEATPVPEPSEEPTPTPTPASTPTPTPTPKPSASASGAQVILNRASLSPMKTNDAELDAMVESILDRIITDDMTTYEKVRACYDYLIDNTVYQTKNEATVIRSGVYVSTEDYKNVLLASEVLSTGKGVCDHYAAALHVMTRRIGLESYICTGKHISQKGGLGGHVWTIITVDGVDYIFDAQIDDTLGTRDSRFCKTFGEVDEHYHDYNPTANKEDFGGFQRVGSASASSGTAIDLFFADGQFVGELDESMTFSDTVALVAGQLRADAGLSETRTSLGAVKVACFCAILETMGEEFNSQQTAELMVEQGVDFWYIVKANLDGYTDPEEFVYQEAQAFLQPEFDGFAAGVCDGHWVVLLYGGSRYE